MRGTYSGLWRLGKDPSLFVITDYVLREVRGTLLNPSIASNSQSRVDHPPPSYTIDAATRSGSVEEEEAEEVEGVEDRL